MNRPIPTKTQKGQSGRCFFFHRFRKISRIFLVALGLVVGLGLAELVLFVTDQPRFYKPHSFPPQFMILQDHKGPELLHVNFPSKRIRFVYDGNPRGYFGPKNEIDHQTNSLGFRGEEFTIDTNPDEPHSRNPAGVFRIAFLGDSFTFGEGVKFPDTFPEKVESLLEEQGNDGFFPGVDDVESYNFGVGGHNTSQTLEILKRFVLPSKPDAIVLGYVLNDAEEPIFGINRWTGNLYRRSRDIEEGNGDPSPPDSLLYSLRMTQTVWRFFSNRERTQRTIEFYKSLYKPSHPGWQNSRLALRKIIATCQTHNIPCCVLLFPIIEQLDDYPLLKVHDLIRREVEETDAVFIDLLPEFQKWDAGTLWVHPADHHPNEKVHAVVAKVLVHQFFAGEKFSK